MSVLYWNILRVRDTRRKVLLLIMGLSLTTNFLLLSSSSNQSCEGGICEASLNHVGVRKVMEYIEREGEVDPVVRDAFVQQIWRYMKNANSTELNAQDTDALVRHLSMSLQNVLAKKGQTVNFPHNANQSVTLTKLGPTLTSLTEEEKIKKFLRLPIVNPHEYSYISNQSTACSDTNLKFIIAVPSAPANFKNRLKVRENRAKLFVQNPKNGAKLLFFLGRQPGNSNESRATQTQIEEEQKKYGDIVQSSFLDSYRNMTKKAVLILRWSSTFCDKSVFVLRMDDDLLVSLSKMKQAMEETKNKNPDLHFILGNLRTNLKPHRNPHSKYHVTAEEYSSDDYPGFLLGGAMGYSVATADLLFKASQRLRPLWLDDVFITGICAAKVGVVVRSSPAFNFRHHPKES